MTAQNLTKEREYLMYVLPRLDSGKVREIMSVVDRKSAVAAPRAGSAVESDAYRTIMEMIGCEEAKACIASLIALHRMKDIISRRKNLSAESRYHMVFTGNPGCNKTTLARLYAKVLYAEGIVSKDRFAELTRGSLCGRYQGETTQKVINAFKKHAGGVIFIDEAYSLDDRSPLSTTYGEEAINQIILELENRPDTVVIFAGYPEKMEEFLHSNPGLRSRIPYHVAFHDYSTEELVRICRKMAGDQGFEISETAVDKLCGLFDIARTAKDFGNGRFCRNLIDMAIQRKSLNLGVMKARTLEDYFDANKYSDEEIFTLDADCFALSVAPLGQPVRRIGFSADEAAPRLQTGRASA